MRSQFAESSPETSPAAVRKRVSRERSKREGMRQFYVKLPLSCVLQIDRLQKRYVVKSRSAVVNAVLGQVQRSKLMEQVTVPPPLADDETILNINLEVHELNASLMTAIQRRLRCSQSTAIETALMIVPDPYAAADQFFMQAIWEGDAVSG